MKKKNDYVLESSQNHETKTTVRPDSSKTFFEYANPKNSPKSDEDLLSDIMRVSKVVGGITLTQKTYSINGLYDVSTITRRFGSWIKALERAGLKSGNIINYTDEELFENILNIWQYKGKQPVRKDLAFPPSKISQSPYNRRFHSWITAIKEFVNYANDKNIEVNKNDSADSVNIKCLGRDPSLRLRYQVLKRDNFSCCLCGASPAKDPSVTLHIDHIIPWSKGGQTTLDNLQTLCSKCNLGKSNQAD